MHRRLFPIFVLLLLWGNIFSLNCSHRILVKKEDYQKYQKKKDVIVKTNDGQSYHLDFFQISGDRLLGEYWETVISRSLDNRYQAYKVRRTVRLKLSEIKSLEAWKIATRKAIPLNERMPILALNFQGRAVSEQLVEKSSELLRDKLQKSGVFRLVDVDKQAEKVLKFQPHRKRMSRIKYAAEVGKISKTRTVITGLIQRAEDGTINISTDVVDAKQGKTEFSTGSNSVSESELEQAITKVVLKIAQEQNESHAIQTFFQSALIPGLGQFNHGHRLRGLFFLASTVACLAYYSSIGSGEVYVSNQPLFIKTSQIGGTQYWMGSEPVTAERYYAELERRNAAELSQIEHKSLKTKVKIIGMCLYFANIFDALIISKKYDAAYIRIDRLSIGFRPEFKNPGVAVVLNF